jgi:hypothetical protein
VVQFLKIAQAQDRVRDALCGRRNPDNVGAAEGHPGLAECAPTDRTMPVVARREPLQAGPPSPWRFVGKLVINMCRAATWSRNA